MTVITDGIMVLGLLDTYTRTRREKEKERKKEKKKKKKERERQGESVRFGTLSGSLDEHCEHTVGATRGIIHRS